MIGLPIASSERPLDGSAGSAAARIPRWLLGLILAYVVPYLAWRLSSWGTADLRAQIDDIALAAPGFLAVPLMLGARKRCAGDRRAASAWAWIAISTVFLTAAFVTTACYQAIAGGVPFPSLVDVFYILFYPLFLVGILRFPIRRQTRAGRLRMMVDAATIIVSGASVVWFLVLGPTVAASQQRLLAGLVSSAYPVGDLLELFGLTYIIMQTLAAETRRALGLLALGTLVAIVADTTNSWLLLHSSSTEVIVNLAFMFAWALWILAPATQGPRGARAADHGSRRAGWLASSSDAEGTEIDPAESLTEPVPLIGRRAWGLPYLAPAVVVGLLFGAQFGSPLYERVGLAICATLTATLVLARQLLAQVDLRSAQGQLSHQALHDVLTGLPNRALVLDRAAQMLGRARRLMRPMAALYVDIDGFKHVNDTFGHAVGDALLTAVAARLLGVVRQSDTVGRLGGDEFVALLDPQTLDVAPQLVAERLLDVLRQPIKLDQAGDRPLLITASVGIAVAQRASADQLLANADMALYRAKAAGKDRVVTFESSMQIAAHDRLLLEMDLRDALAAGQLFLVYQPTFDLRDNAVSGVEALIRWRHPTRGVLAPELFVPLAEEAGTIVPIGRWVLREACRQAAAWHRRGHSIGISVNVSGRQLDDERIVDEVRDVLASSGLDPRALTLEITETTLMRDATATAARLRALKHLGVRIAIDDFGTGYSSMAYLSQFPVDALKIDRSFISGIAASAESAALIHTLVQLGKTLKLDTLGEGIEDQAQLRNLRREQCDYGQGFLLARPLAVEEVERFLDATGSRIVSGRETRRTTLPSPTGASRPPARRAAAPHIRNSP